MSVELAVVSSLKHDINTKLGLLKEYNTTAGEDVKTGDLLTIGTDGKGYLKYRPDHSAIVDEAKSVAVNSAIVRMKYYDTINGNNSLIITNPIKTTNGYISVVSSIASDGGVRNNIERIHYIYKDSSGNENIVTYSVYDAPVIDTYNNSNRWRHYNGFLQQIDNDNYILYELFYTDYYDGNAWQYETHIYYSNVTLDENNKSISVSSRTQLLNVAKQGSANDWHFHRFEAFFNYDSSIAYFVFPANTEVVRFKVAADKSVSVDVDTTNATNAVGVNNYSLYVDDGTTKGYIWRNGADIYGITANNATDATKLRTIASGDPDENFSILRHLDTNIILGEINGDLYILKYNPDATVAFCKKITPNNFKTDNLRFDNRYSNIPTPYGYKNADGSYTTTLITNYLKEDLDTENNNFIVYVIDITTDSSGNYYATKKMEVNGCSRQVQNYIDADNDNYFTLGAEFASQDGKYAIYAADLYFDKGVNVPTFRVKDLYAKADATAGNPLTMVTTTPTIPIAVNPGEVKGEFIGIADGIAVEIDKGE